jgi:integrase
MMKAHEIFSPFRYELPEDLRDTPRTCYVKTAEWKPNAALALRKSSMRIYSYQLEKHILPTLGEFSLRDIGVAHIEACLSKLKQKGHATSTLRSVRATFATVLRSAVKRGYLERNHAHGVCIREADSKKERRFYSPEQTRTLLGA